ncbi:MAG: hypothetical protein LBB93_03760 [Elusimicrobiota bacterium]|jgi:hypothetical protein|nr:hypothetical protein [Elusimicrobiota bacterium]
MKFGVDILNTLATQKDVLQYLYDKYHKFKERFDNRKKAGADNYKYGDSDNIPLLLMASLLAGKRKKI